MPAIKNNKFKYKRLEDIMQAQQAITHATESSTLADVLERILDKGIVIAGDIKVKLVDIELLTIQVRLLIASVDKAREMGMYWWVRDPDFNPSGGKDQSAEITDLERRISELEQAPARAAVDDRRVPA